MLQIMRLCQSWKHNNHWSFFWKDSLWCLHDPQSTKLVLNLTVRLRKLYKSILQSSSDRVRNENPCWKKSIQTSLLQRLAFSVIDTLAHSQWAKCTTQQLQGNFNQIWAKCTTPPLGGNFYQKKKCRYWALEWSQNAHRKSSVLQGI